MITVASHLAQRLSANGARHVFMVTGGGAMFLNDAFAHQPGLTPVCFHHEQAAAMAAEAYARIAEHPPVLNVTTGPGGINALNGVFGAWTDSVPMIVISGQVKRATCLATTPVPGLRQLGDQEGEIVPMARGITKYAAVVERAEDIAWHLDQALHHAFDARPGPVWLDIPIDVQSAAIDPEALRRWTPPTGVPPSCAAAVTEVIRHLHEARRPVIMAGTGRNEVLTISANGYGKRTSIEHYPLRNRGGMGVINMRVTPKTGQVIGAVMVLPEDELLLLTSANKIIRLSVSGISTVGRATQGVMLVRMEDDIAVTGFDLVDPIVDTDQCEPAGE